MKGTTAALIFGLVIIAIGVAFVLNGGMTGSPATPAPPVPTSPLPTTAATMPPTPDPTTATPEPTTAAPVTTTPPPTVTTAVPPTTTPAPQSLSAEKVGDHFINVAYASTNKIERLNYASGQDRVVISVVSPAETDITMLEAAAKEFNSLSNTVKLSENIKESSNGDIVIKLLPESGLDAINLNEVSSSGSVTEALTKKELTYDGKTSAKILRGTMYINGNLKGDVRNHTIMRSLYYQLGLTGETDEYTDSLFYAADNSNAKLSPIDKKVVTMLYEPGLYNGMNMQALKQVIYIE